MKNVLLTGRPGVGKTTLVRAVVGLVAPGTASGFYTQEIRESNRRVGFELETLTGKRAVFAHVSVSGSQAVGKYGVDLEVLDRLAVPSIDPSATASRLLIVDEIGRMECLSPLFREAVLRALASETPVLGTVPAKGDSFISDVCCRGDVELIEVTPKNRNSLAPLLLKKVGLAGRK